MTEKDKLQMIRREISIALSHPQTDSYITSKASLIFRMLKNHKLKERDKIEVNKLRNEFEKISDPFDWHKNLVSPSDLGHIENILEKLRQMLD